MRESTKVKAQNRWRGILTQLGFEPRVLSGKHTACPICGGKDRFRFTDYKGGGEYFCSGCEAGGGFDLVMKTNGWDFRTAAKEIDKVLGNGVEEVFQPEVNVDKRRKDLNDVWAAAKDDELWKDYLTCRRIDFDFELSDVRGHPALRNNGKREPAMVSLIRNPQGRPISIHRIFMDSGEKKIMPPVEKIVGGGIRLGWDCHWNDKHTLVVGEGVETTIAGMADYRCAGMATISAHGMEELQVPGEFSKIIILADHDASFTGQKAAFTLARRMDQAKKVVQVIMPSDRGDDYNDVHRLRNEGLRELTLYFENARA